MGVRVAGAGVLVPSAPATRTSGLMETCKCGEPFPAVVLMADGRRWCTECYIRVLKKLGFENAVDYLEAEEERTLEAQRWNYEEECDWG